MLNIVISLLTFVLILISLFMVLVILMQRANTNAGMGSAFGGGVTESAFGAETTNILTRATKWSAVAFFLIARGLYLLYMSREGAARKPLDSDLPDIPMARESAPALPFEGTPAADAESLPTADESLPATGDELPLDVEPQPAP
jgi:preprotein translocase subunit SecG